MPEHGHEKAPKLAYLLKLKINLTNKHFKKQLVYLRILSVLLHTIFRSGPVGNGPGPQFDRTAVESRPLSDLSDSRLRPKVDEEWSVVVAKV